MLFYSFFKTLVGQEVTVHLKNSVTLTGTLVSVDQFLNLKLDNLTANKAHPQLASLKNVFVRGSVVRYVELPPAQVDTVLLQDAARRESATPATTTSTTHAANKKSETATGQEQEDQD